MIGNSSSVQQFQTYNDSFLKGISNECYEYDEETIIIIWNKQNEIIYVSNSMEKYFDKDMHNLIGEKWSVIFPDNKATEIEHHFKKSNDKLYLSKILLKTKEDEYLFRGTIDIIVMNNEEFYICKLNNTTYHKELRRTLLDSEKLILAGQLSAGLVHEIRNPLTSLKGFLQLVQAGVEQKEEYYKVMIGEIDKLEKITSELLHLSKPFKENKKNELLHDIIKDVIFIMSTQLDMRNIQFVMNVDKDIICYCDASQIKQVLINIIKNGAEAMEKSGTIIINSRTQGDHVAIDIIDQGQGLSEEEIRELNTPFYTTKPDGTGLGLVISHHILDMHDGQLEVNSNEGKETTFTVILPKVNR